MIAAKRLAIVVAACVIFSASAQTQWLDYPTAGIPRLPNGKPNLTAPTPRAADGKPDLSGIWEVVGDRVMETDGRVRSKYVYNIAADLPGGAPFLPWAKALYDERQKALGVGAPSERCLPHGIPDAMLTRTLPFKIMQMRGVTVILYEEFNNWRQVFTDGRPLPKDPQPAWLGYSVGSWDGETFVIETAGFNDRSWLDAGGTPHTEALRTTRAPAPHRRRSHGDHVHVRRPEDVHEALVGHGEIQSAAGHRTPRASLRQREVGRQAAAVSVAGRLSASTVNRNGCVPAGACRPARTDRPRRREGHRAPPSRSPISRGRWRRLVRGARRGRPSRPARPRADDVRTAASQAVRRLPSRGGCVPDCHERRTQRRARRERR